MTRIWILLFHMNISHEIAVINYKVYHSMLKTAGGNGKPGVRVIQLPTSFYESCGGAIVQQINGATIVMMSTNQDILSLGSTSKCLA